MDVQTRIEYLGLETIKDKITNKILAVLKIQIFYLKQHKIYDLELRRIF